MNYTYGRISDDEYDVGKRFLESLKKQSIIVADKYSEEFGVIPIGNESVLFKKNEKRTKTINICRKIIHNKKSYVVNIDLEQDEYTDDISITNLYITNNGVVHSIDLDNSNGLQDDMLYRMNGFINTRKIVSPEQAYASRMYTTKALQGFIEAHEWDQIAKGIKEMPSLAHSLFIIKEAIDEKGNYTVDFGTILYQLVDFRQKKLTSFDEKDLLKLDNLIQQLRKTELLKVQLHEFIYHKQSWLSNSILLGGYEECGRIHTSKQFTCDNTELSNEEATLKKCIKHK